MLMPTASLALLPLLAAQVVVGLAMHCTASHRIASHRTASHRIAPLRTPVDPELALRFGVGVGTHATCKVGSADRLMWPCHCASYPHSSPWLSCLKACLSVDVNRPLAPWSGHAACARPGTERSGVEWSGVEWSRGEPSPSHGLVCVHALAMTRFDASLSLGMCVCVCATAMLLQEPVPMQALTGCAA